MPPVITGLANFTERLLASSMENQYRNHYRKNIEIHELWEEDENTLKSLPNEGYPVRKEQLIKVNAYNVIKLDDRVLHIPKGNNHIQLFLVST
jgi:hypothetical protein